MSRNSRKDEALVRQWKESLFDTQMPGGALDLSDLDDIIGASAGQCGACTDSCSNNSCCNNSNIHCKTN